MATDITGLLTGISSKGIDPMANFGSMNSAQQRMALGAQAANRMKGSIRGMLSGGQPTAQQQIQSAASQLDLSAATDLEKVAKLQQLEGDFVGATRTLQQIREIKEQTQKEEQEANSKQSITNALMDLGLTSDLALWNEGAMTQAQAMSVIQTTRKAIAASKGTEEQQLNFLIGMGIGENDELYKAIAGGAKFTADQLSQLVKLHQKDITPAVSVTGVKPVEVITGKTPTGENITERKLVGHWKLDHGNNNLETIYGTRELIYDADGKWIDTKYTPVDPARIETEEDRADVRRGADAKGIDVSNAKVKQAAIALATAGSSAEGDDGLLALGTDWDDAWKGLSTSQKNDLALLVAQETERYIREGTHDGNSEVLGASYDGKPMDVFDARKEAIQRLWLNRIKKGAGNWIPFFDDTRVMSPTEIQKKAEKTQQDLLNTIMNTKHQ
jgi:hypothetical protein